MNVLSNIKNIPKPWLVAIIGGGLVLGLLLRRSADKKSAIEDARDTSTQEVSDYGVPTGSDGFPSGGGDTGDFVSRSDLEDFLDNWLVTNAAPNVAQDPPDPVEPIRVEIVGAGVTTDPVDPYTAVGGGPPDSTRTQPAAGTKAPQGFQMGYPNGLPADIRALGALGVARKISGNGKTGNGGYIIHDLAFKDPSGNWKVTRYHHYTSGKWRGQWKKVNRG